LAVIVVEATDRSGALSTARWASDLGRDLYAVPGSILDPRSRGTNLLIRDGAIPLLETSDLAATFAGLLKAVGGESQIPTDPLLALLGSHPVHADWLAAQLGIAPQELATQLVRLEMDGRVQRVGGSSFRAAVPR
jgi:DNA processing protein